MKLVCEWLISLQHLPCNDLLFRVAEAHLHVVTEDADPSSPLTPAQDDGANASASLSPAPAAGAAPGFKWDGQVLC